MIAVDAAFTKVGLRRPCSPLQNYFKVGTLVLPGY